MTSKPSDSNNKVLIGAAAAAVALGALGYLFVKKRKQRSESKRDDGREERSLDFAIDNSSEDKLRASLWKASSTMYFAHCDESLKLDAEKPSDDFKVVTVQGGITNQLYKCTLADKYTILIRVYGAKSEEVIDRKRENLIVDLLSKRRFGPGIFGRVRNGRLEEFLPGTCLNPETMVRDEIMSRVAGKVAELHQMSNLPLPKTAGLWGTLEMWMSKALQIRFDDNKKKADLLAEINLPKLSEELAALKAKIGAGKRTSASPIVFAHNDLLSGNIMWDESTKRVELVDYEYGQYNYRGFDLANHFCECCGFDCDWKLFPSKEKQTVFFRPYLAAIGNKSADKVTQDEIDALHLEVMPFVLASHFFWGTWAILQARYSPIDFDYLGYSKLRFGGYWQMKDNCLKLI